MRNNTERDFRLLSSPGGMLLALCALTACGRSVSTAEHLSRGAAALANGDYRQAWADLESAVNADPRNARSRLLLAQTELQLGAVQQAEQELTHARRYGASLEEVARLKARILLAQGHVAEVADPENTALAALQPPERAQLRGEALLALGRLVEAERLFQGLLEAGGAQPDALLGLAQAHLGEGRFEEAAHELDRVAATHRHLSAVWKARASILAHLNQRPPMRDALLAAIRDPGEMSVPQQAHLMDLAAQACLSLKDIKGAQEAHARLAALLPGSPIERLVAGRLAEARGDLPAAIAALQDAASGMPRNPEATFLLGRSLLAHGELDAAIAALNDTLDIVPDDVETRRLLVIARMRAGQSRGAAELLSPVAATVAKDPSLAVLAGLAYLNAGEAGNAIGELERDAQTSPGNTQIELLLTSAYLAAGQPGKAFPLVDHLMAANGRDTDALLRMAAPLTAYDELDHAGLIYQRIRAADPTNVSAALGLAGLAERRGDLDTARKDLEAIRGADPHAVQARLMRASIDLRDHQLTAARALVEEAVAASSNKPEVLAAAGRLYLEAGQLAEAVSQFSAATALAPRHTEAWIGLSAAQLALNHIPEATQAATRALAISPDSVPALRARMRIELKTHQEDAALQRVQAASTAHPYGADAWELLGDVHMARKEYSLAAAAYDKAADLAPGAALLGKAVQARREAQMPDALRPLELWVHDRPGDPQARRLLTDAYREEGRLADVQRLLLSGDR